VTRRYELTSAADADGDRSRRPTIVWFRQDLRLDDNPALAHAAQLGAVLPVFVDTTEYQSAWLPGEASRWWLGRSLAALDSDLRMLGSRLVVAKGDAAENLIRLASETGAQSVVWNNRYEPTASAYDARLKEVLRAAGLEVRSYNGRLLHEPWEIRTGTGGCYKVFTPYWNRSKRLAVAEPVAVPKTLRGPATWPRSLAPLSLGAAKVSKTTAKRLAQYWMPGERGAQKRFQELDRSFADAYPDGRDFPSHAATSRLSPHLHFGEVGPNRIHECLLRIKGAATTEATQDGVDALRRQLGWRDFTYHLLHHFPHTPDEPLRPEFDRVEWRHDSEALAAWVRGRTGYPIVDAGMRELAETGWMHNRVRMIVGSFLTKDLLIDWREGAMVFWDRLVDADLANNTFGWQWAAGCGADAAPYFRIFNPTTQAKRFDPDGAYVRRWIPELDRLPIKYLHDPWNAPSEVLRSAGIELGREYPGPIVDHAEARKRALEAFAVLKSS
jgi:deoxyribodipyrimidine photo-lyase